MRKIPYCVLFALLCAAWAWPGESGQAQPYEKIRYPTFRNGRLYTLLEADQAEAYDLTEGLPKINLRNVVITVYDHSDYDAANGAWRTAAPDRPLPARMVITSDTGLFVRRPPDAGSPPENIAHLEGNVLVRQMQPDGGGAKRRTTRPSRMPAGVQTEIRCQHATWNHNQGTLKGDGDVEFLNEDSRILGTGFLYMVDDEVVEEGGVSAANLKNLGGVMFIEHNARMEIERPDASGGMEQTVITCGDTASYKLREHEIQFERDVVVQQPRMRLECAILKVFLRQENDPVLAEGGEDGATLMPGQVKNIIATIGTRSGEVTMEGFGDEGKRQFFAKGGRADYSFDTNTIVLTDSRTDRAPSVELDLNRISDRTLDFVFSGSGGGMALERLTTSGGQGQVMLRSVQDQAKNASMTVTDIVYKGGMTYSRKDSLIRFRDEVVLINRNDSRWDQPNIRIDAEMLDVRVVEEQGGITGFNRVVAETDANMGKTVDILYDDSRAKAHRAEYEVRRDARGVVVEQLVFHGAPSQTPPAMIELRDGNSIAAPVIHMARQQVPGVKDARHLLTGSGGVVTCNIHITPDRPDEKGRVITIKSEDGMEYNQAKRLVVFSGQVMASSDIPEDNYVLTSDKLDIYLTEKPREGRPDEMDVLLRRIDANGSARLQQDGRVCEAHQIIRDFPTEKLTEGDIYLEGRPAADGRPAVMAMYREEDAQQNVQSMFVAPRIMASASGNLIRANGPGHLSTPDDIAGFRSEINFVSAARYESFQDGRMSEAKFRGGVTLRQPSRATVLTCQELDARFVREGEARPASDDEIPLEQIGRLRRVEARNEVKLEQSHPQRGVRVATGDRGVVELTDTGNVVTMAVDRSQNRNRWVLLRDHDGLSLRSPQVEVRELQGVTRAAGPGELQIPGNRGGDGLNRIPTVVQFGENGTMVYNELALNIRVTDNVKIIQPGPGGSWSSPSLDGRCDRLDITLLEAPSEGMSQEEAMSRVGRMDATGGVLLRVYADPPPDQPNIDWLNRPGLTFFTRGDHAVYEVPEGRIVMSSLPGRQPQLLMNTVDVGRAAYRQRLKADRFILYPNTVPRRWNFEGQMESNTLKPGEPFEFQD